MPEWADEMQARFTHGIGGWIVAEMTIHHDMPDRQRDDAGCNRRDHALEQGQIRCQLRYGFDMVLAAFRSSALAFGHTGSWLFDRDQWFALLNLQRIRTPCLHINQRHGHKRHAVDRALRQARIEASASVRRLARFANHHFVTGQQVFSIRLKYMYSDNSPQHPCPLQRAMIPALDRSIAAPAFRPACDVQHRDTVRDTQHGENDVLPLPHRRLRQIRGQTL